jgi:agmatine/peptidylarginine deiminase
MKKNLLLLVALFAGVITLFAQPIYNEDGIRLYHTPSQEEIEWAKHNRITVETVSTAPPPSGQIRPIAEFEPAEAVLVRYSFGIPISLIKKMAEYVKVITIVSSASQQTTVLNQYNSNGVNTANCQFLIANTDSYWTRDYGPWFMAIDNHEVAMFDFTYNRTRPNDNLMNQYLAQHLNMNRYASTLTLTGGNYMNDGIKQAFSSTLILNENSGGESYIKNQLQEYLGVEQFHFIPDCIYPYDNIQHIDCWGKLLAPNKVLITQTSTSNPNYNKFEYAANYFASLTSSWGMPFEVYRVYEPAPTGSSQICPYTNSLILNNKVFVPVTGNSNDAAALQVYNDAMPGYEIIPFTASNNTPWLNTDALHCRTHEIADRCMLYIKHQPLFGEIENTGTVTFSTELYSYCDNPIYSDSVIVYVRVAGGAYTGYKMTNTADHTWEVTVTNLPNELIEYYLFAKDESGRKECHPYIGAPDPHKFFLIGNPPPPTPVLSLSKTISEVSGKSFETVEDYITLYNLGDANLTFEVTDIHSDADMLTVTPGNGTVQPEDSAILTLSYLFPGITKGSIFEGGFKLLSNDPLQPETVITCLADVEVEDEIKEANISGINIYPNPVHDRFVIEFDGNASVKLYDILGKEAFTQNICGKTEVIINHLPKGVYFIRILSDNQIIGSTQIVKQ